MNTATAPHQSPPPSPSPVPPARPNGALRGVLLLIGTVLILGLVISSGIRVYALATSDDHSGVHQVTEPVDSVSVRTAATNVRLEYGQVASPQFEFTQSRNNMALRHNVRGGELSIEVEPPGGNFGFWTPSFSGSETSDLVVTLPSEMAGTDVALRTRAGQALADGDFGALQVDSTAGRVHLAGSAESLQVDKNAGDLLVEDFATTGDVRIEMNAGEVRYDGTELPASIDVSATAADVTFELPRGEYEIVTSTTAAMVNQNLPSAPGADRVYTFSTTAGSIDLSERP